MKVLRFYIWKTILLSTLLVLGAVAAVEVVLQLITQLASVGIGNYDVLTAVYYVLLQLPYELYQLFPVVGFMGGLIGLGGLASNSELIVMRSAGMSKAGILRKVLGIAMLMLVVVTAVGELLAPKMLLAADQLRSSAMYSRPMVKSASGHVAGPAGALAGQRDFWLRQGKSYIYIKKALSDHELADINLFQFDSQWRLLSATHAKRGLLVDGGWRLAGLTRWQIKPRHIIVTHPHSEVAAIDFKPKQQAEVKQNRSDQSLSIVGLVKTIYYLRHIGLESNQFQYSFWHRLLQPLATIIMICLGIPFVFGSLRTTPVGRRVVVGIMVGFSFYVLNSFFGEIGLVYQIPPLLAAVAPSVLFIVIYIVLNRRVC